MQLDLSTKTAGEQLRIVRVFHGLKQVRAAKRLRIDASYLSLLENGERDPSDDVAERIEREFGIPVGEWTKRADTEAA